MAPSESVPTTPVTPAPPALAGFPVVIAAPVAWGEMDAFAHVNNTVYFRWFESARIAYFERMAVVGTGSPSGVGPILASTSCRFKVPLRYPDTVHIGARIRGLKEDRFTMEYDIFSAGQGRLAARGEGLVVAFDYDAQRKAPVPAAWIERITALEQTDVTA